MSDVTGQELRRAGLDLRERIIIKTRQKVAESIGSAMFERNLAAARSEIGDEYLRDFLALLPGTMPIEESGDPVASKDELTSKKLPQTSTSPIIVTRESEKSNADMLAPALIGLGLAIGASLIFGGRRK